MNEATKLFDEVKARVFAPRPKLTVSEWAEKYRVVDAATSPHPGRWSNRNCPHLVGPMDAMGDPLVRHVSIMKPVQCGGTEIVINAVLYWIDCAPGPMFWLWANDKNAVDHNVLRMRPTVKLTPRTASHLTGKPRDEKNNELILDNMVIRYRGVPPHSKGVQNVETWATKYIINDELDRCDPNTPAVMESRTEAYADSCKRVDLGSPGDANQGIHKQVSLSAGGGLDFWTPCPHCGRHFVRHFDMVRWIGGTKAKEEYVRASAWLRCPFCEEAIRGDQNLAMMQRGVWAPDWDEQRPPRENVLPSQDRIDECLHAPHVGFRIGEFSNGFARNAFGDVAVVFVHNKGQATEEWTTRRRGRAWTVRGERMKEHELLTLCTPIEAGGYQLGVVPPGVLAIETAIDVQEKEAWVRVRGWGRGGGESWLIWMERVELPGGDLAALDKCVGWSFPLAPPASDGRRAWCDEHGEVPPPGGRMHSVLTVIDSGDGDRTVDVYNWVLRHGGATKNVFAVKGQPGTGAQATKHVTVTPLSMRPDGKSEPVAESVLKLINVNTNFWKTWLLGKLRRGGDGGAASHADGLATGESTPDTAAAAGVVDDGGGGIGRCELRFPEAVTEPGVPAHATSAARMAGYFRQLTSEERVEKLVHGRYVRVWQWREGGGRANHYFDCECYGAAALALRSQWGAELQRSFGVLGVPASVSPPVPAPAVVDRVSRPESDAGFLRHLRGG